MTDAPVVLTQREAEAFAKVLNEMFGYLAIHGWNKPIPSIIHGMQALDCIASDSVVCRVADEWKCGAKSSVGANDPQDCNWPMCGCDPYADKVIAALQECGAIKETSNG